MADEKKEEDAIPEFVPPPAVDLDLRLGVAAVMKKLSGPPVASVNVAARPTRKSAKLVPDAAMKLAAAAAWAASRPKTKPAVPMPVSVEAIVTGAAFGQGAATAGRVNRWAAS